MIKTREMPIFLHPAMTHRWFVRIGSGKDLITMQAVSCLINMKQSEITLTVQQPAPYAQEMIREIASLASGTHQVNIDLMDGNEGVIGTMGGFGELIHHEFLLDYSMSAVASHKLVFKYKPSAM